MENGDELPEDEGVGDEELFEVIERDEGFEEEGELMLIFKMETAAFDSTHIKCVLCIQLLTLRCSAFL